MMSVLDMLRSRLGGGDNSDRVMEEMLRGNLGQPLPRGLPLGVQDSIRNRPSYGEGEIMAPQQWWNPALGGQLQMSGPQREDRLLNELSGMRDFVQNGEFAVPEGGWATGLQPGQSPFASPLNQLLQLGRRAPLSMY